MMISLSYIQKLITDRNYDSLDIRGQVDRLNMLQDIYFDLLETQSTSAIVNAEHTSSTITSAYSSIVEEDIDQYLKDGIQKLCLSLLIVVDNPCDVVKDVLSSHHIVAVEETDRWV